MYKLFLRRLLFIAPKLNKLGPTNAAATIEVGTHQNRTGALSRTHALRKVSCNPIDSANVGCYKAAVSGLVDRGKDFERGCAASSE